MLLEFLNSFSIRNVSWNATFFYWGITNFYNHFVTQIWFFIKLWKKLENWSVDIRFLALNFLFWHKNKWFLWSLILILYVYPRRIIPYEFNLLEIQKLNISLTLHFQLALSNRGRWRRNLSRLSLQMHSVLPWRIISVRDKQEKLNTAEKSFFKKCSILKSGGSR